MVVPRRGGEDDGACQLEENEGQFGPEGEAQDAVLAVVDAQALVLGAQEDCGEDVAADEKEEAAIMNAVVVIVVEYREEY